MGITRPTARFIIREAKYKAFRGAVLLLGRQTVSLTPTEFHGLLDQEGVHPSDAPVELDNRTVNGAGRGWISDSYFFKALGATNVDAMDVSDYEGATITHNLNEPAPQSLESRFDFICNGSVLDNLFSPATALINTSRMLKPDGRIIHFEHASNAINAAYLQFSPNWFFDYYALNGFADCKSYLAFFNTLDGGWELYACLHDDDREPRAMRSNKRAMTLVVAEKSSSSTVDRLPAQMQYRGPNADPAYAESYCRFCATTRPIIAATRATSRPFGVTRELLASIAPARILGRANRGYRFIGNL